MRINMKKLFQAGQGNDNPGGLRALCTTLDTCCAKLHDLELVFDMWFNMPSAYHYPPSETETPLVRSEILDMTMYWFVAFGELNKLKHCNMKVIFSHRQPNHASFLPNSTLAESLYGSFIEKMRDSIIGQSEDLSDQIR